MCGIFAYIGQKQAQDSLITGLRRLEYRGYDSAGICISDGSHLHIIKQKGPVDALAKDCKQTVLQGTVGIAHTRWATHGPPNKVNAHPHVSKNKEFAIVHNGIIENYASLRELLENKGIVMKSQTDTEVLVHLIEQFYDGNLLDAVREALMLAEGTYGIAVIHASGRELVAARKGSPLVLGIGKNEMIIASDIAPVLTHTKNVLYLEDDDIVRVTAAGYDVENINGLAVSREIEEITWKLEEIQKSGYPHFMLKEIFEQPAAISNRLRGRIRDGKLRLSVDIGTPKRIMMVACGTSWHACLIGKQLIERRTRIPVEVDYASEFRYRDPIIGPDDLLIVISQSGETADTLEALRIAKQKGAKTLGLVNVVGSTIAREVDSGVYLHAGPEIGVASTKAFTSQVVSLQLLSLYMQQQLLGKLDKKAFSELMNIPAMISSILELSDSISALAGEFVQSKNFLYLGRGLNFPVALEGALKLKEISYIHAEGYPAAEMKHGPIALIDDELPVLFIATKDATYEKILSNMQEVKARGGRVIAIASQPDEVLESLADYVIVVPQVSEELSPILNTIPLQLFSYYVAAKKGLDVDKPRNLAKSVTVE